MPVRPSSVRHRSARSPRPLRAVAAAAALGCLTLGVTGAGAAGVDDAQYVSRSVPGTLYCGQTANVSVTMRNTGTSTWLTTTYRLRPTTTTTWGVAATGVAPSTNVTPGANGTFAFTITAPATGGTYAFQWQMHNGVAAFGAPTPSLSIPVFCEGANGYRSGYREVTGTALNDLFNDSAHVVDDPAFSSPLVSHVEQSTVFFGGRYLMYHRHPTLRGIALATSNDGHTWTAYNGGAQVLSGPGDISAPNVMVDRDPAGRPRLAMVYEHCDNCGGKVRVGRSYSYDGIAWTAPLDVVIPSATGWDGQHTGTPNVVRTPDGRYRVGFHAHPSTGNPTENFLTIGFADGASLDATLAKAGPVVGNATVNAPGWWAKAGVGKRDIVKEGSYWYMVFEGMRGDVNCSDNGVFSWGLARTPDATFKTSWEFSVRNPIRIDRQGRKCGEDMPAFQVVGGVPYITVPAMDQLTPTGGAVNDPVKRYKIVSGPRGRISTEIVAMARASDAQGYYEVNAAGNVYAYGSATFHGSPAPTSGIVGIAAKPGGGGYWLVSGNGVVYNYGTAGHFGDPRSLPLVKPIVGITATPSGNGYWLVAGDGGVFNYGDAPLLGSMGGKVLNAPMVGMAATTSGNGYWLVASDGGVFNYGDAPFHGSMGGQALNAPVVGIAGAPNNGYWLVGRDGGIFAFPSGQPYAGSTGGLLADMPAGTGSVPANAVAIVATPASVGYGYWILFRDGGILDAGPARYFGDPSYFA
ncbi:MAG TPA: hypothetical protein VGX28_04655 [Frankiaceae bacterium]|jgi:hypothetical protein|nr:hypothetical protein [Frankiaceae bacterium]